MDAIRALQDSGADPGGSLVATTLSGISRANEAGPDVPEAGQLVRVRGQQWVVSDVRPSHQPDDELAATRIPGKTLVTFTSVSDDDLGDVLTLVWEVEPDR
jgi:hypothetical protein